MGGVFKSVSKAVKGVTKGFTKAVKSTVKRVKKVGKAVMKGVAKISNKLGPIGMIALSIAMPYALAGLSSMTTAAMASQNVFLQSIGTVGNAIRTGYQAFNVGMSKTFSTITNSISKSFQKFAPKGTGNMFSRISQGAKNLYTVAKEKVAQYTPDSIKQAYATGKEKLQSILPKTEAGNVEFFDDDGSVFKIKSTDFPGMDTSSGTLGKQTLTNKGGFFTNQAGVKGDQIVTDTINEAYKQRLEGFSPDATRYYNDVLKSSKDIGSYVNNEEIGSYVENAMSSKQTIAKNGNIFTDTNLGASPDYNVLNEAGTEFGFTGKEAFKSPPVKSALEEAAKKAKSKATSAAKGLVGNLLTPTTAAAPIAQPAYYAGASSYDGNMNTGYGGTNIKGSQGGSLVAQVFGDTQANQIRNYYQNMNILGSIG